MARCPLYISSSSQIEQWKDLRWFLIRSLGLDGAQPMNGRTVVTTIGTAISRMWVGYMRLTEFDDNLTSITRPPLQIRITQRHQHQHRCSEMDTVSPEQVWAARASSRVFSCEDTRPDAKDLSHHLSALSKSRRPSPLKELFQYIHPGILSFAGGSISPCPG
jgi:hypothetical protein